MADHRATVQRVANRKTDSVALPREKMLLPSCLRDWRKLKPNAIFCQLNRLPPGGNAPHGHPGTAARKKTVIIDEKTPTIRWSDEHG